jgi:hypothetical protein
MKLLNEKARIQSAAEIWKSIAFKGGKWIGETSEGVYRQLAALDAETATIKDVERISSILPARMKRLCDECLKNRAVLVQLGEEPVSASSATVWLCRDCLRKAVALIEAAE